MSVWGWIPTVVVIVVIVAAAIKYIKGLEPLLSLFKQVLVVVWKRKKMWPVKIRLAEKPPFRVSFSPGPSWYEVSIPVTVEIKRRKRSLIDSVTLNCYDNDHSWSGSEVAESPISREPFTLPGQGLDELRSGAYTIHFRITHDEHFTNWHTRRADTEIDGKIVLATEGLNCETETFPIKTPMAGTNPPS